MLVDICFFLANNGIEYGWEEDSEEGNQFLAWIPYHLLSELFSLIPYEPADDVIKAYLTPDYAVVDLKDVLDCGEYNAEDEFDIEKHQH